MTRRHPFLVALAAVLLLIVIVVLLFDWNWLRGPIERRVSAATGRPFAIHGDLDVNLSWHPTITVRQVELGNVTWSRTPAMLRVPQAAIRIDLRSVLQPTVIIEHVGLKSPELVLEKNAQGQSNWQFPSRGDSGKTIELRELQIDRGHVKFRSVPDRADMHLALHTVTDAERPMVRLAGVGTYAGLPTEIAGEAGAVLRAEDLQGSWPLSLHGSAGATRFSADGTVVNPLVMQGMSVRFELAGRNLADLYPLAGVPLPPTPPYSIEGRLQHQGALWSLTGFNGRVGRSDLSGSFTVDRSKRPQAIQARLSSSRLDMADLAGFVGGRTEAGTRVVPKGGKVLPDEPFNLDKLKAANMDVRYRAQRILTRKLPLDDLTAHLIIHDGRLQFDPLNFGVAGGDIRATINMNAGTDPLQTRADIQLRRVHLQQLFEGLEFEKLSTGTLGGTAHFAVAGNSVARMLASANGRVSLLMDGGSVSVLAMRLANLDIARSLLILLQGDRTIPIRCMISDFEASNGVMQVKTMVLDTEKQVVYGSGAIDFRTEGLNLTLKADPKDISLVALRGPIKVGGTFSQPTARPDVEQAVGRAAVAVALGTIAPPLALLPLIEPGDAHNSPCRSLMQRSEKRVAKPVPSARPRAPRR